MRRLATKRKHLAQAHRHLEQAERLVAKQVALIERLKADGRDVTIDEHLLEPQAPGFHHKTDCGAREITRLVSWRSIELRRWTRRPDVHETDTKQRNYKRNRKIAPSRSRISVPLGQIIGLRE